MRRSPEWWFLEEQLEQARLGLLQQRGFDGMAQWAELLEMLGRSEDWSAFATASAVAA